MSRAASIIALTLAFLVAGSAAAAPAASPTGSWTGTYTLVRLEAVTLTLSGSRATVALGPGHAGRQTVPARVRGGRVRFTVPGLPPVAFDGRLRGRRLAGTVRQGGVRGSFSLGRGSAPGLLARGFYDLGGHGYAVAGGRLLDLESGEVHGLYANGRQFDVGSGFAARRPVRGTARFDAAGAVLPAGRASRVLTRQLEVRFRSERHSLGGTLTLPPGPGPHPAVVWVHGGGPQTRNYFPDLPAAISGAGFAVLTYDKRGVGQSTGSFPGDRADAFSIDALARDAEAAVRFLAAQPGIDRTRVGLVGHSQGGWIAPLAATREPAVRFVVAFAGPSLSQRETDHWAQIAGAGQTRPTQSEDELEADVLRQGSGGYEPLPALRALRVPSLWLFGRLDYVVPTRLSIRRLREVGGDVTIAEFPKANHALVETQTGLTSEMLASDRFAPGLFPTVRDWLRRR
jgi:pimeloyl-ACP methyl ester carboxylesterase